MSTERTCKTPECGKPGKRTKRKGVPCQLGWCSACLKRRETEQARAAGRTCAAPDCTSPVVQSRRWCGKHATRLANHGELEPPNLRARPLIGTCEAEGCDEAARVRHVGKQWCRLHGGRIRHHGDAYAEVPAGCPVPLAVARERIAAGEPLTQPRGCAVEECDQWSGSRRYCPAHTHRLRLYGDLFEDVPVSTAHRGRTMPELRERLGEAGEPTCSATGCERVPVGKWCPGHRTRVKRFGEPFAEVPIGAGHGELTRLAREAARASS